MRDQGGTGGNTLGIREDNQTLDTGGRASYLKQQGKVSDFQNKTRNDETRHEQNINRDSLIQVIDRLAAFLDIKLIFPNQRQ